MCEFALNSTKSASTDHKPVYVLLGCEPVFPLEHAVRKVTDCPVQLVTKWVAAMQSMVQLVCGTISRAALTMAKHANRCCQPADAVVDGYAWLSTEHLKLAPGLSQKLAAEFFRPFWVTDAVSAVSFHLDLPS